MRRDLWRLLAVLLVALLAGWAVGQVYACLFVGTLGYLIWQYRQLLRLPLWIRHRKRFEAPDSPGVMEEICRAVDFLRDRDKRRKGTLATFLNQFLQATSALTDAALILGEHDEIQWANPAAARHLGIGWPRDLRQRITNLVRDPQLANAFHERPGARQPLTIEIASPVEPGRILSVGVVPFGGAQTLLIARDITRLHRLSQAGRDLVANVSHELRTPLTVIRGYLESLSASQDLERDDWRNALAEAEGQALRMQGIIDDLLLLSRLEQEEGIAKREEVRVPELLTAIYREAQALERPTHHIYSLEIEPGLGIRGAASEIHSAFSNLVVNAVQYTPDGGVIRIRWQRDDAGAHLEVSDTGIGIPPQHLGRLTERFYRVDQSRARGSGGTGLGLAIVKHVLKRHGAELHIESVVGMGSTFRCDFPPEAVVPLAQDLGVGSTG